MKILAKIHAENHATFVWFANTINLWSLDMARYHKVAEEANQIVITLFERHCALVQGDLADQAEFLASLLKLYNLGIRTSPRACQATVRRTAVEMAAKSTPVTITMTKVPMKDFSGNPIPGRYFNALGINSTLHNSSATLDDSEDEE